MDVLVPMRTTNEDNGIRFYGTNRLDNLHRVCLHLPPTVFHRFVENLIDDIRNPFVTGSHLGEELLCFFLPQIVAMPVDDDVNAVLDSSIHHFRNTLNTEFGLVHIAGAIQIHSHRGPKHLCAPVIDQISNRRGIVETGPELMPAIADTVQYHRVSFGIHQLRTIDHQCR